MADDQSKRIEALSQENAALSQENAALSAEIAELRKQHANLHSSATEGALAGVEAGRARLRVIELELKLEALRQENAALRASAAAAGAASNAGPGSADDEAGAKTLTSDQALNLHNEYLYAKDAEMQGKYRRALSALHEKQKELDAKQKELDAKQKENIHRKEISDHKNRALLQAKQDAFWTRMACRLRHRAGTRKLLAALRVTFGDTLLAVELTKAALSEAEHLRAELQDLQKVHEDRLRFEKDQRLLTMDALDVADDALDVADDALLLVEQQQEQLQVSQQAIREARERSSAMQEKLDEINRFYPEEILSAYIEHQRGMLRTAAITAKKLEQEAGAAEVAGLKQENETLKALNIAIQHECNVCMQANPDCHWACFRPCGHVGTCWNCAEPLDKCPICQEPKESLVIARR